MSTYLNLLCLFIQCVQVLLTWLTVYIRSPQTGQRVWLPARRCLSGDTRKGEVPGRTWTHCLLHQLRTICTGICNHSRPGQLAMSWDAGKVQEHPSAMVRATKVSMFPEVKHCYCNEAAKGTMVACDICHRWFHRSCLSAGHRISKQDSWRCRDCVQV